MKKKKIMHKRPEKRRPDAASSDQARKKKFPIPFTEHEHFKIIYRPVLIKVFSSILMVLMPIVFLFGALTMYYYLLGTVHGSVSFWIAFLACIAMTLGWPMVIAMSRLPKERFACFGFLKFFLRLKEPYLVITSYTGECPVCSHTMNLVFNFPGSLIRRHSYFGKCSKKSEHAYPFRRLQLFPGAGHTAEP